MNVEIPLHHVMSTSTSLEPSAVSSPEAGADESKASIDVSIDDENKPPPIDNDNDYLRTPKNKIAEIVDELRYNFYETQPSSYQYRMSQLKALLQMIDENKEDIIKVYMEYFGGFPTKHRTMRIYTLEAVIIDMINNLHCYMKEHRRTMELAFKSLFGGYLKPFPRGVVLVISPWNYPVWLTFAPVVGAIAAGNAVVIKFSEITSGIARLFDKLIPKYLDNKMVRVVHGGIPESTELLKQKFDYIFFTGAPVVGKIIMRAAAEHLTPVTLELGGKNPVIIDDRTNIEVTMRRVTWGRFWNNCGQLCVAPEYIIMSESKVDELVKILRKTIKEFFIEESGKLIDSEHYGRIVNKRHWDRINKIRQYYLNNNKECKKVVIGNIDDMDNNGYGRENRDERYLPPMVIVIDSSEYNTAKVMQSEIFGPILTIVTMKDKDPDVWKKRAVDLVRSGGEPLACYVFSTNNSFVRYIYNNINAGTIMANDTCENLVMKRIPFGGVGESGMGSYGGKGSFDTFSHYKPLAHEWNNMDWIYKLVKRYPPGNYWRFEKIVMYGLRPLYVKSCITDIIKWIFIAAVIAVVAYLLYFVFDGVC